MKDKWYQAGLSFECTGCGNCCAGPEEGYVWVTNKDMQNMAEAMNLSLAQFKSKYARRVGIRHSLIEHHINHDCILLQSNDKGKGCQLYQQRPLQCRTWPFWPENLSSPEAWQHAAQKCPGINQGQYHSFARIEAISKGRLENIPKPLNIWQAVDHCIQTNLRNSDCIDAMTEVYRMIDQQIQAVNPNCENCGKCCNFRQYDHRLYVTTLEMLYFVHGLNSPQNNGSIPAPDSDQFINACDNEICPYQNRQGCIARDYRPVGCRIFYCNDLPAEFQNELTEQAIRCLRDLHDQLNIIYSYADLLDWLNHLTLNP
ncbi:MAG: YkgJ family cysteine cluster protein [Sedimentisphaerales bacterium]|nr:YkgJ family cysteine cluster protein [Sedimentisphaerales bacterium]